MYWHTDRKRYPHQVRPYAIRRDPSGYDTFLYIRCINFSYMNTDTITIGILLHASAEKVWKAWTDPDLVLKWFGSDPNGTGLNASMDVRPGGAYEISFKNAAGPNAEHTCFGKYTEVEKYRRLAFSWTWKNEPGVESFVTVSLTPEKDHTHMKFEHAHVGYESAHNYEEGWRSTFEKLEKVLGI